MNKKLIHEKEKAYFILCLIISISVYVGLILSVIGLIYIGIGVLVSIMINGLMIGHIKNNGVKLNKTQFSTTYDRLLEVSSEMEMKTIPDVYVIQSGGLLNAFATRFFGRNFVIIYSDLFEIVKDGHEEELNFVLTHELAHIKRNHIVKNMLILPSMWIPFLGSAYSRSCELTCDRVAAAYTHVPKASVNALNIIAIGKELFNHMNTDEYIKTTEAEKGFFVWLSEVTATHPPLPKRIKELQYLFEFPELFGLTHNQTNQGQLFKVN